MNKESVTVTLLVNKNVYKKYVEFCKKKGLIKSRQFQIMMEKQMEGEK